MRATQDDIYGVDAMSQKGFTLIELMITIAVLAMVLGIAVPSFSSMLRDTRASSLGGELQWAPWFARSEKPKRYRGGGHCRVVDGSSARATVLGNAIAAASHLSIKPATRGYQHNE